jgi:hypothetical protein
LLAHLLATAEHAEGPDWAAITTAVATAVTAIILGLTALFIGRQLADARRTRHAQLLIDLSRRWDEPLIADSELASARFSPAEKVDLAKRAYAAAPSQTDVENWGLLLVIPNLCETLGVLEAEGAISLPTISRMWGTAIQGIWRHWEQPIDQVRETTKAPRAYVELQRLAGELENYKPTTRLARVRVLLLREGGAFKSVGLHLRSYLRR